MNELELQKADESMIRELRDAREVPAVMKLKLVTLRSNSSICVFAFEGPEDKVVYFHWVKRAAPEFVYEPFLCNGKEKVLQLREMLERDQNGLSKDVYFFIDRDYDDLRGQAPSDTLFMTDAYSFENYLVSEGVLEELLKNELHCHAEPICRGNVIDLFRRQYEKFLTLTRAVNFRIFIARRCKIERLRELPDRINALARIALNDVDAPAEPLEPKVLLQREPTPIEIAALEAEFNALNPAMRYRGKFALMFFRTWLQHLIDDRNHESSILFGQLSEDALRARGPISLDSMAARSAMPKGLHEFIGVIAATS